MTAHTPTTYTAMFRALLLEFEERAKHYGRVDEGSAVDDRTENHLSEARVNILEELDALVAERDALRNAVAKAYPLLSEYAEGLGGCDHSVGICQCGLNRDLEDIAETYARFGGAK